MNEPVNEVFFALASWMYNKGYRNVKGSSKVITEKINERWIIAFNPLKEPQNVKIDGTMGCDLPFMHFGVWYNGWLAGIVNPSSGEFAAGDGANVETFFRAINYKLEEL